MRGHYQARCSSELLGVLGVEALATTGAGGRETRTRKTRHGHPIGEASAGPMADTFVAQERVVDFDGNAATVSRRARRPAPNEPPHEAGERRREPLLECGKGAPSVLGAPRVELTRGRAQPHHRAKHGRVPERVDVTAGREPTPGQGRKVPPRPGGHLSWAHPAGESLPQEERRSGFTAPPARLGPHRLRVMVVQHAERRPARVAVVVRARDDEDAHRRSHDLVGYDDEPQRLPWK